jgi:hypothetical protein
MLTYNKNSIEIIRKNVNNSLKKCEIPAKTILDNNGRVIVAYNEHDGSSEEMLYLWLRLLPSNDDKYIIEVSSIILPSSKRNCGVFQIIYNRLKRCKYIAEVRITGVCTTEMYNWCKKNKLVEYESGSYK